MRDIPESEWRALSPPTRRSSEFVRFATRVGAVVVITSDRPLARGLGYQTTVALDQDDSVLLVRPDETADDSLNSAEKRHRELCWYWAKAERQAEARARIKGRRG